MYKLKNLSRQDIDKLPEKIKNEILALINASNNFDPDLYDIFKDNDAALFKLADAAMKKKEVKKPTPKIIAKKAKPKKVTPKKSNIAKYKKGDTVYYLIKDKKKFTKAIVVNVTNANMLLDIYDKEKIVSREDVRKTKPKGYTEVIPSTSKKPVAKKEIPTPSSKQQKPQFSWKNTTEISSLTAVSRKCHEYYKKAKGGEVVSIKATGNNSKLVTAKEGEYIMFNADGYVTHIKNETAFKADCKRILEDEKKSVATIIKKEKTTTSVAKKVEKNKPTPTPSVKKVAAKSTSKAPVKKRKVCTIEHEGKIPTVVKKLIEFVAQWHNNKITWQIKEVFRVDNDIIISKADYAGFKGVLAFIGKKSSYKYYRMCVESGNLTPLKERPKSRPVINTKRLDEMYRMSNFADVECAKVYRELLTCSLKGNCEKEQKEKFNKLATKCNDFIKTIETSPALRRAYYNVIRKRRKDGEDYHKAKKRITQELKEEAIK